MKLDGAVLVLSITIAVLLFLIFLTSGMLVSVLVSLTGGLLSFFNIVVFLIIVFLIYKELIRH